MEAKINVAYLLPKKCINPLSREQPIVVFCFSSSCTSSSLFFSLLSTEYQFLHVQVQYGGGGGRGSGGAMVLG